MAINIKKIYVGLPDFLSDKLVWVDDVYRVNELSNQPGGCDVVVEYVNGNVFGYDRIKHSAEYIRQILINEFAHGNAEAFDNLAEEAQLKFTKQIISSAYNRRYEAVPDIEPSTFERIWDSQTSEITLLAALQKPDDFEVEQSDNMKTMKLMVSQIEKSKSGINFDALC